MRRCVWVCAWWAHWWLVGRPVVYGLGYTNIYGYVRLYMFIGMPICVYMFVYVGYMHIGFRGR